MNKCVPFKSCGTLGALWSDDAMPSQVGLVTQIRVYAKYLSDDDCRYYAKKASVMRCSENPNDFVYRYDAEEFCYVGFCGMSG